MNQAEQYQETELGELPKEWEVLKLGDTEYFEILSSGIEKFSDKKEYLSTESINRNRIEKIECEITISDRPSRANMQPLLNSVWFAKMKKTIKVYSFEKDNQEEINKYVLSTGFCGILCKNKVNTTYVKMILLSDYFNNLKDSLSHGTTQQAVNNNDIRNILIPLPPLSEQQNIAFVLSTVQNAQQSSDRTINSLKELKKSLMKHLFTYGAVSFEDVNTVKLKKTEIGNIPQSWEVTELGNVVKEDIKNGAFVRREQFKKGNVLFLNVADTYKRLSIDLTKINLDRVKCSAEELKLFGVEPNDLFYVRSSLKRDGIGQCCIVENVSEPAIYDCHIMRVRPDNKKIISKFLAYYSITNNGKQRLVDVSKTTTMTTINQQGLRSFKVPVPSIPEQQQISDILSNVDEKIYVEENRLQALNEVFSSLLKNLMTAKVRVNDLNINAVKLASMNKNEVVDVINNILPADNSIDYSRADFVMSLMGQLNDKINNTTKEEVKENIKKTKEWLKIAEEDLESSKSLLKKNQYRNSMVDLQQAVEKLVKAYCIAFHILPDKEIRDVSHKTPMAFIKMVKRDWVAPYVEVLKQRHPELSTDTTALEKTIHTKDDELANINEQTLGVMLDTLDKIEIALESKNDEVKGFIKKITSEFGEFMEEKQKKNIDFALGKFDMRLGCAFMNLYILSAVTYPHFMSRYPDDKMISLTSYDDNLAVIKHADRIFKMMEDSIYQLKNYLEIQNGKDWN